MAKLKDEITAVKKESHKRKKLLIAQQHLMHAGVGSYNKVWANTHFPDYDMIYSPFPYSSDKR